MMHSPHFLHRGKRPPLPPISLLTRVDLMAWPSPPFASPRSQKDVFLSLCLFRNWRLHPSLLVRPLSIWIGVLQTTVRGYRCGVLLTPSSPLVLPVNATQQIDYDPASLMLGGSLPSAAPPLLCLFAAVFMKDRVFPFCSSPSARRGLSLKVLLLVEVSRFQAPRTLNRVRLDLFSLSLLAT